MPMLQDDKDGYHHDAKSNPLLSSEHQQGSHKEHLQEGADRPVGRGLPKSQSWRKLSDYVTTGEVLLAGRASSTWTTADDSPNAGADDEIIVKRREEKETTIRLKRWHFQRMMSFSLTQVMLALLLHVVVAIIAFSFLFHNWTVIDSIYFAVVTISTVGYGDLVVQSHAARFFTCVYALSGVTCLGIAIGVVSANIAEAKDKAVREAKEIDKRRAFSLLRTDSMAQLPAEPSRTQSFGAVNGCGCQSALSLGCFNRLLQRIPACPKPSGVTTVVVSFVVVLLVLGVFGVVISRDPAIDLSEVAYFLVVSATTLGFGDLAPVSQPGRLATAFFIPIAVATMGQWLAIVAKFIVDQRQETFQRDFEVEGISLADLQAMDSDDDGNVSRADFLEFMLLAMSKVDKSLLEELRAHFDRLDADRSGLLSKSDLIAIARRRLKKPSRKLELARYKKKLHLQAEQGRRKEVSWFSSSRFSLNNIFPSNSVESHDREGAPAGLFRTDTLENLGITVSCTSSAGGPEGEFPGAFSESNGCVTSDANETQVREVV